MLDIEVTNTLHLVEAYIFDATACQQWYGIGTYAGEYFVVHGYIGDDTSLRGASFYNLGEVFKTIEAARESYPIQHVLEKDCIIMRYRGED